MKTLQNIFLLLCLVPFGLMAGGRKPPQQIMLAKFVYELEQARAAGYLESFSKWSDIESLPLDMQGRLLGSFSSDQTNVSDYFVIIPAPSNHDFKGGSLMMVSAEPFNLTEWYRRQVGEDASASQRKELIDEYDRLNTENEIVRWYATKDLAEKWSRGSVPESFFQEYLTQTQLSIPRVTPYRFNRENYPELSQDPPVSTNIQTKSTESTSQAKPAEIPSPESAPTQPTTQSANLVWWIVGLIIFAAGVIFVARKK